MDTSSCGAVWTSSLCAVTRITARGHYCHVYPFDSMYVHFILKLACSSEYGYAYIYECACVDVGVGVVRLHMC